MRHCQKLRSSAGIGLALAVLAIGCTEGDEPFVPPMVAPIEVKATVGASGGIIAETHGAFTLSIPVFTFQSPVDVTVSGVVDAPADSRVIPNTVFAIKTNGATLNRGATLSLAYDPAKVPAAMGETSLRLYKLTKDGWTLLANGTGTVDVTAHTVTSTIQDLGVYAVRSVPVHRILLGGAAVNGGLFVGQTASIGVTLYRNEFADVFSDTPLRPVAWKSSAPAIVAVDASGKLTATALGTATITATVEGITAQSTITVLARPPANFARSADWTTFQGNNARNGFADITVDPVVFVERWRKTPSATVQYYNQIVTGGGKLFLVTSEGARQAIALNALGGDVAWQKSLGPVSGSYHPTYDRGSLYFTTTESINALNTTDGSSRFQTPTFGQVPSAAGVLVVGSTLVSVAGSATASGGGGVYGFDVSDGHQLFRNSDVGNGGFTPAAAGGVFYSTANGISTVDAATGAVVRGFTDLRVQSATTPILGSINNLLTQFSFRLTSVDLAAQRVNWDVSADNDIRPVVGNGVVYSALGGAIVARKESDGTQQWSWKPAVPYTTLRSAVLTNNLLFVTITTGADNEGFVYAIDLASHLPVWSFPFPGALSIGDGTLYIAQHGTISAISLR